MKGLRDFMNDWSTARLDEYRDYLREEFDIDVRPSIVSRALEALDITYKRATRVITRRDDTLISAYIGQMANHTSNQLVTVNESAANNRIMDGKFDLPARGTPYRVRLSNKSSTRRSILPAMTIDE